MPTRFRLLLPLLLAASTAGAATPLPTVDPAAAGFSAQRLERLHDFMRDATDADGYLGGVTLVARDGRLVDWQAYGHRDLARREPMQRDDIFRIYSMTKTITSVAVLMLLEEGRLALEDPATRYLPELAVLQVVDGGTADAPVLRTPKTQMTLRHLLTHTAGFSAGLPGDELAGELRERVDTRAATDLRGVVERLSRAPLAADPGTRFGYEGANTDVLARVVEVVSGQSFDAFLQQRVFDPLRMVDTGFSVPTAKRNRVVDITVMGTDGTLVLDDGVSAHTPGEALTNYPSGAGGLYSTAGDYARFAQMLLGGGTLDGASILGRKTVELMLRNHLTMLDPPTTQFGPSEGFGLGGYVVIDAAARAVPGSNGTFGWTGAASTAYSIDPQERLLAIVLLQHLPNGAANDLPRIGRRFQALVPQALVDTPVAHRPSNDTGNTQP